MSVKTKICGITNEEDAVWAVNLGVNFLGLNFAKGSPRKVSPDLAARIVKKVPPFVPCVGVFVEQTVDDIVKTAEKTGIMGIQLHGAHTPEDCRALSERLECFLIRSFRVATEADLEPLAEFKSVCKHFLLDAKVEGQDGGTGQSFPWDLARRAKAFGPTVFVAGGLNAENVAQAIEETQPFAVDVASGVEKSPKRKDYDKMKAFIEAVKYA
jgi:phosphoribosylanthranilate isomerase